MAKMEKRSQFFNRMTSKGDKQGFGGSRRSKIGPKSQESPKTGDGSEANKVVEKLMRITEMELKQKAKVVKI